MKYTSPIYENEKIMTSDVICESPYRIETVDGATEVRVSFNSLS